MAAKVDLTNKGYVEGDDWVVVFVVTEGGDAYDFSTVTKAWFTVKVNESDPDSAAKIGPLNSDDHPTQVKYGDPDPGAGKIRVRALASETSGLAAFKKLYCDIQLLRSGQITTIIRGLLKFEHEITQATS